MTLAVAVREQLQSDVRDGQKDDGDDNNDDYHRSNGNGNNKIRFLQSSDHLFA